MIATIQKLFGGSRQPSGDLRRPNGSVASNEASVRQLTTGVLLLPLLSALLGTTACRTTGTYRVVDLPEPPGQARRRVEAELERYGFEVQFAAATGRGVKLVAVRKMVSPQHRPPPQRLPPPRPPVKAPPKKRSPANKKRIDSGKKAPADKTPVDKTPADKTPADKTPADKEKPLTLSWPARAAPHGAPPPAKRRPALTVTLHPKKAGTRVLLHARDVCLQGLFRDQNPRDHKVGFGLNGPRLLWEAYAVTGYRYAPGYGHGVAMEAGARLGYRVLRLGGGTDRPEPGVELALAAGLGGGLSNTDKAGYAMPSLTLSYLIRRTLEPIPGKVIPVGPEFSIDLHAVALLGDRRRGLEGQLVFRYNDIGGLYVGAGYQWLPTRGATFTVGLYLSTIGAATAALIAALAAG